MSPTPLVEVSDLVRHFRVSGRLSPHGVLAALDGVSFEVFEGETLGIVGESGCGKSTLGRLLVKLDSPTSGTIRFGGMDLEELKGSALRRARRDLQMVFQDPSGSLDPLWRAERIVSEPLRAAGMRGRRELKERSRELLATVGLDASFADRLPSELSGGQKQRVGIARAIATNPRLIVADEPVSALDVSVQAQVINLLADLQEKLALTYVFIAHGLEIVRHLSDRVAVMYLGRIVELASTEELFSAPAHHYTAMLLAAVPSLGGTRQNSVAVVGEAGSALRPPPGCRFNPRCPASQEICRTEEPPLVNSRDGHLVACHFPLPLRTPTPSRPPNFNPPPTHQEVPPDSDRPRPFQQEENAP